MSGGSSTPPWPSTPTQANIMSDEQMDLVEILRSGDDSRLRRHRPERIAAQADAVVLFCGADQDSGPADWDEQRPWAVAILPETEPPPARKRQRRSNGCGARIHVRAIPDRRWRGLSDGVSAEVVPLEERYFTPEMKREVLMGKERCGCCRSGVGCAICGNALGALFTPCPRHAPSSSKTNFSSSHYTFLRSAVSPPLPPPSRVMQPPSADHATLPRRLRDDQFQQPRTRMRLPRNNESGSTVDDVRQEVSRLSSAADAAHLRRADLERMRRARVAQMVENANGAEDDHGFAAWADATIQRATARAASPVPVIVDLGALMGTRGGRRPSEEEPMELSEEERRRDWQRYTLARRDWNVTRAVAAAAAVVGIPGDTTAPLPDTTPPPPLFSRESFSVSVEAQDRSIAEEQEKEDTPRVFFER